MSKKTAMFSMGEGRGDHARIMMAASMLCSDTIDELEAIDEYAADIRSFIVSLEPPKWPFDIDKSLANQGELIFNRTCAQCHGQYGPEAEYPSRVVPLELIQTDPTLIQFAMDEGLKYVDWYNRSYYGNMSTAAPAAGYVAPPHNGSVPSIRAVLDQSIRPLAWRHKQQSADNKENYDQDDMGWRFEKVERSELDASKPIDVYDTGRSGYGNSGHPFGNHLTDAERSSVIEYLKTL